MPADENLKQKWVQALQGLECGSSNYLCINHFNHADIKKKGNRFVLDKNAVPIFERENLSKNIGDDDDDEDRDYGGESSASHTQAQELSISEPNELEYNEEPIDTTTTSMYDPSCNECKKLVNKVRILEQQITDMNMLHSVEILKMEEKLSAQKGSAKKHVQEKKNLKRLLTYHKSKELKLQEVIGSIHDENLISNEAAADLNVIS